MNPINSITRKLFIKSKYRELGISWLQEKIIKHRSSTGPKKIKIANKIVNYSRDEEIIHCLKEIFFEKSYLFKTNNQQPLIYDCGAHIGMSILFYKLHFPDSIIKAFEPDETNFQLLNKNITEWNFNNIELFPNPVWNKDEEIRFEELGAMGGKITSDEKLSPLGKSIKAIRLSNLITSEIDFLKIDIEGAEYEVIVDCQSKLHLVRNLFIEYHSTFEEKYKLIEILKNLEQSGFDFYIKEANNIYPVPFSKEKINSQFDIQLNIFAFRKTSETN